MKRIRLNQKSILFNATAMAEQLTAQSPSSSLTDLDKAYLAHVLGLHAILVKLRSPGTWMASKLGIFGDQPEDLVRLLGASPDFADELRKLEVNVPLERGQKKTPREETLVDFARQVYETCFGGIQINAFRNTKPLRQNIYAYALLRHGTRAFQHYSRRLRLLIPAYLEEAAQSFDQVAQKAWEEEEALRESARAEKSIFS